MDLDELERRAFARAAAREPSSAVPPSFLNAPPIPLIGPYQMVDVRLRYTPPLSHCHTARTCSVDLKLQSPDLSGLHIRFTAGVTWKTRVQLGFE